ncbi:MAG: carbohydrate-binding protein [Rhodocyclaceae bacterium]|nr:carbohydrate-binding protein [Rhodocyclaceae bacterium]MDZ4213940.1 carbohydrate-binding protein [Rhodocyclaceae bacterium]
MNVQSGVPAFFNLHIPEQPGNDIANDWSDLTDFATGGQFLATAGRATLVIGLVCTALGLPMAAHAQTSCVPTTAVDWMVTGNPLAPDIRPHDCQSVLQSPPDFRWPDVITSGGYQVTLTYPDGRTRTLPTTQNWLNWDEVLPAGSYSWTASYAGSAQSNRRRFSVDANSKPFLVPKMSAVLSTVTAKPHPRSLPDAATFATMKAQRATAVNALLASVGRAVNQTLPADGLGYNDAYNWSKLALNSLVACVYSNEALYCNDAVRRVMNLAAWDPNGATSYLKPGGLDMAGRYLTWTVALGYDWLFPRLTATQRGQVLSTLNIRTGHMYNDIIGTRARIARHPRDSHGNQTLTALASISSLLAGDLPVANTWLTNSLPLFLNHLSPWSGDDGGYANGTPYGMYDMGDTLPNLIELKYVTGINVAQKAWVRNWARFIAYFMPPGMLDGSMVFGDSFETSAFEHQSRYGKGYTYFAPSPLGRWHMSHLNREDQTRFEYLMAPPADFSGPQPLPAGTPNALHLPSIGFVAMHSDLAALDRTSVYFKSSPPPYGAFNHQHADQNAFVVNTGGKRLAIESGYYDGYKSSHFMNWYHTTKAKNAITFDGGLGQIFFESGSKMGYGKITSFNHTADYDIVTGDATQAYGGALTLAQRMLVYLRPNLILVYDNLASATGRQWEWNIHSLFQMTATSDTKATIQNGNESLCVTLLAGPTTRFSQTNQFTVNPTGTRAAQWHGRFASTTRLPSAEFVTLLNVGCEPINASATKSGGTWTVALGDTTQVTIEPGGVSVGKPAPPPPPPAPTPTKSQPYSGTPITVTATIPAQNFDRGGQGVAYHDTTKGNAGGLYRLEEDVDIYTSCDSAGGDFVIKNFNAGEWLNYTINVPVSGTYEIGIRASNNVATGAYSMAVDGVNVTGTISQLGTGSFCNFKNFGKTVHLAAGVRVLTLRAEQEFFHVNSINVVAKPAESVAPVPTAVTKSQPYSGTPITVPATFAAENFDRGGQGVAYHDTTKGNAGGQYRLDEDVDIIRSCDPAGGGYVVNNFADGEWMNYTINVPVTGYYEVGIRGSSNYPTGAYRMEVDGVDVTGTITALNTGNWCGFKYSGKRVLLQAGVRVLTLRAVQQYFNVNSINVVARP